MTRHYLCLDEYKQEPIKNGVKFTNKKTGEVIETAHTGKIREGKKFLRKFSRR